MRGTSRTGKSVSRAWGFLSRNPTNMPVLCSKACSALVVGPSFFLSSCPYKISQQSHVSRPPPMYRPVGNPPPTRMHVLQIIIAATADLSATVGMFRYPDYIVTCHKVPNDLEGRACDGNSHLEFARDQQFSSIRTAPDR